MSHCIRIFVLVFLLFFGQAMAQTVQPGYLLSSPTENGTTFNVPSQGAILTDDNGQEGGFYSDSIDYAVTLVMATPCSSPNRFCLEFNIFDIAATDTLYIYDGLSIAAPLLIKANNAVNALIGSHNKVFVSPSNSTNGLTIRLVTSASSSGHQGFSCVASCEEPCENLGTEVGTTYYRLRNGVIYDSLQIEMVTTSNGNHVFPCVNLCQGDGLMLKNYGQYESRYGYYNGSDVTSIFIWDMGIDRDGRGGVDTIRVTEGNTMQTDYFSDTSGCFDIHLSVIDEHGCQSYSPTTLRVRITTSPIKTIASSLPVICSDDTLLLRIGSNMADNAAIIIDTLLTTEVVSKVNNVKTFIPDGPACAYCYDAPVTFSEFPNGRTITSKEDICSICINFEHSYMSDYDLKIICPNGQKATLKYKDDYTDELPEGAYGGDGIMTGYPYGGDNDDEWDASDSRRVCDSLYNMFGIGLDYCFSRNRDYTLVDGWPADTDAIGTHYLANLEFVEDVEVEFPSRPSYMRSGDEDAGYQFFATKHPSDHANKKDYYRPADDFSSLVGCPLNGEWKIRICDSVAYDNGWIFNWTMDICQLMDEMDCTFDVHVDSVRWQFDEEVGRYENGRYIGPYLRRHSDTLSYILFSDTAGTFPLWAHVYDDFGCRWNAQTLIKSIWVPKPNLGGNISICTDVSAELKAEDRHANEHFSYVWHPIDSTTQSIHTIIGLSSGTRTTYAVMVTNNENDAVKGCVGNDSIVVEILPQPMPNFDVSVYPMEGCEPLLEEFTNHSRFADSYRWVFGDGFTSTDSAPSHSFLAGDYDIRFYAFNKYGCKDSLVLPGIVSVLPSPHAQFSWSPAFPLVRDPKALMENLSIANADSNKVKYTWEYQTVRDDPSSIETNEEKSPTLTWSFGDDQDAGRYLIRLIAKIEDEGPSGNSFECLDTSENYIYIINDFLQFPTLVTPNGDGVNDRFIIKNLVNGWAYSNSRLDIFNRWGMRVFHVEDIKDEKDFWSPADTHSPTGTYFWRFTAQGPVGLLERNGSVEVIR